MIHKPYSTHIIESSVENYINLIWVKQTETNVLCKYDKAYALNPTFLKHQLLPGESIYYKLSKEVTEVGETVNKETFSQFEKRYESDISDIKTDVSILTNDVSILKNDVSILKNDVSILKNDVSILKNDMTEVKKDISDLKGDMSEVKSKMGTKDDIKDLESRMATKDDIKDLESRMATKDDLLDFKGILESERNKKFIESQRKIVIYILFTVIGTFISSFIANLFF